MGGINISGRIKQSFYPRTRHGELKVISMIYAPPYLMRRRKPKVKSIARSQRHPSVTPVAHKTATLEASNEQAFYYYEANTSKHQQEGNTIQRTTASHLPSRVVTNRLSGALVTHDGYRTLIYSSSCLATGDQTTVINMARHTSMACQTSMARGVT